VPDLSKNPDGTYKVPGKTKINNVLDLIGATVTGKFTGEMENTLIASPFPNDLVAMNIYLPQLMDSFTATGQIRLPARININQAPRCVLMGIPGMTEEMCEKIIGQREPEPSPDLPQRRFETWMLSEGVITLAEMKALMPFVCAGGGVFRTQVVGYFDEGGPSARIEAVIDATNGPPRVLFWRNISHLGRGFDPGTLGVQGY
jgi:hypothetical protein